MLCLSQPTFCLVPLPLPAAALSEAPEKLGSRSPCHACCFVLPTHDAPNLNMSVLCPSPFPCLQP